MRWNKNNNVNSFYRHKPKRPIRKIRQASNDEKDSMNTDFSKSINVSSTIVRYSPLHLKIQTQMKAHKILSIFSKYCKNEILVGMIEKLEGCSGSLVTMHFSKNS